jgi:UDP-N-acetylmuramoyl-tripeptide--D-alanyl-D-alanine ligase
MRAALTTMAEVRRNDHPRRIAVLGDMLELGAEGPLLHAGLAPTIEVCGVDLVFAAGQLMRHLFDALPQARRGAWAERSEDLKEPLLAALSPGDVVMIKGSNGSRMAPLVAAVKTKYANADEQA